MLSPAEVRFWFEERDGRLYWRMKPNNRVCVGSEAGTRRPDGIVVVTLGGQKIDRSRIVWAMHNNAWPTEDLRHRDGDSSNDRIENLTTQSELYTSDPSRSNLPYLHRATPKLHTARRGLSKCCFKSMTCQAPRESHFFENRDSIISHRETEANRGAL